MKTALRKYTALLLVLCLLPLAGMSLGESLASDKASIEEALNLANNADQEWTYSADADAWVLSVVSAVVNPVLPDQQGLSVAVPGAYVSGIDSDGDGVADVTASTVSEAVKGKLVINYTAEVTSTNGQVYTAATAPLILNTGAAGYGSRINAAAETTYAKEGYINIACGNRGKTDSYTDADGNTVYTGDAPSCLVDQKNAARYVRYNILLSNLPGNVDYLVSTGGSGGGAHAIMFAATSNHADFYPYQVEAGAVGVYRLEDGSYSTTVNINGEEVEISDGAWGTIAYSPITSLYEADAALAFEYSLNPDYAFSTNFQTAVAGYLAQAYMDYINGQNLVAKESALGHDINKDGDTEDEIALTIAYDAENYASTGGYYGTYLDLYLAEAEQNLQWYLDNLDYAEGWTWFAADGTALSDEAVAALTLAEKQEAFIKGLYTKSSSNTRGAGMGGNGPTGNAPTRTTSDSMAVGTPDSGSTQSSSSSTDSANYSSFAEMLAAYESDIAEIQAGDAYGQNIVNLYNPLNYIGNTGTQSPTWARMLLGASEGDISMLNSLNLQLKWLENGVDAELAWQWNGGHVPSEILGDSFALYVDSMYAKHVGGNSVSKAAASAITANGSSTEASGTDISSWVSAEDLSNVSFSLASFASYRSTNSSKAIPGFDVMDYGQEDYVFGSATKDARHWSEFVRDVFKNYEEVLSPLFNAN